MPRNRCIINANTRLLIEPEYSQLRLPFFEKSLQDRTDDGNEYVEKRKSKVIKGNCELSSAQNNYSAFESKLSNISTVINCERSQDFSQGGNLPKSQRDGAP